MSPEQVQAFLAEGTRTGKLGTLTPSGHPHVMPVWFVMDGADVVFNTGKDTVKGRHILGDGRVSLCVDDEEPPFSFVHLRGRAVGGEGRAGSRGVDHPNRCPVHGREPRRGVRPAKRGPR
jgi:PPOX class probable F420-dependent enzyme